MTLCGYRYSAQTAGTSASCASQTTPSSGTRSGALRYARSDAGHASPCCSRRLGCSPPDEESLALLPDAYAVVCTDLTETFELALQGPDYTAVRSWQEAAPPGYNVNVA